MCLIFFAVDQHPEYKLVVAANRDEFYNRKTAAADFWSDHPFILGGRDLEAVGTWLGMTRSGRISMLTNYRDVKNLKSGAPSRGKLVSDYLITGLQPDLYLQQVAREGAKYNGFNLIAGTIDELWYYSNYGEGVLHLKRGIYGLSNHLLDTPWPKVARGKSTFTGMLESTNLTTGDLFTLLSNEEIAQDDLLPETGLPLERERALSSMFIKTPDYGSRSSTVILVDRDNHVSFVERIFDLKTFEYSERCFEFSVEQ